MRKLFLYLPFILVLIVGTLFYTTIPKKTFFSLPVVFEGRLQPYDSVARNTLLFISEKQNPGSYKYTQIFQQLISHHPDIDQKNIFLIRDPQVLDYLNIKPRPKNLYPFTDLVSKQDQIREFASLIEQIDSSKRNPFQRNVLLLQYKIDRYIGLKYSFFLPSHIPLNYSLSSFNKTHSRINHLITHHHHLTNVDQSILESLKKHAVELSFFDQMKQNSLLFMYPSASDKNVWLNNGELFVNASLPLEYIKIGELYYSLINDLNLHSQSNYLALLKNRLSELYPDSLFKVNFEYYYNHFQLFYVSLVLYFLLFIFSFYLIFSRSNLFYSLYKSIFLSTFIIHSLGILMRIFLISRPPVTNLYSSAIFVSWVSILAFIILYRLFKFKLLISLSSLIGFVSLIIAHQLSIGADTLENMRAVLDSNFWLSTHVVTMCMGYGAVYVASFLASAYMIFGYFTTRLSPSYAHKIFQMTYGFVCVGLLFSVIGTLLGGIWGDQSWGRFWGWDPKENGAILIVLWLAMMLHARLAGLCKVKGFMSLSVFAGVVTSFSWFGVNLMGVGLHSYGFIAQGFFWLVVYSLVKLYISCLVFIPNKYWRSLHK